ncbi:MAG: hypothetical protein DGJ47_000613 [Rickettsiaceae bacterium]
MAVSIKIFKQEAKFVAGVAKVDQFPRLVLPQVAFIGKSNVGKSSLINKLCNRRALASVSHTPGRTQQINFFSLEEKLLLADLPGYGFAKVSGKQRANWEILITHYLNHSEDLKLVNLLIDSRRGFKTNDFRIIEFLKDAERDFQVIFTKADQIKSHTDFINEMQKILALQGCDNNIILTSSKNNLGIKELQYSTVKNI